MPKLPSVLLVDDDWTTNYLNQLLLERLGVAEHVLVAENGQEALAKLDALHAAPAPSSPALILLDLNMPVMNGLEFLEAFQQLPAARRAATRVVLLTTSVHPRDLDHVRGLPVAASLAKPLTETQVRGLLAAHFAPG